MMTAKMKTSAQQGNVMMSVLIFIFVLSALWIIALSMTGSELSFVGGRKVDSQRFYDAEAGVAFAINTLHANIPTGALTTATKDVTVKDANNNPVTSVKVTVMPIHPTATNMPQQEHEFDPPEGSGSGVNTVVARRYAITSEAGGRTVQAGVYWVVPK